LKMLTLLCFCRFTERLPANPIINLDLIFYEISQN
ncbi:MAG: hypothetical protein ACI9Z4_001835, partial [Polaribacter sp.]